MNPLIGAGLISGAANLGGGLLGFLGGQSANAMNNAFAWAQMQAQQQQFNESMAFAHEQFDWNKTSEMAGIRMRVNDAQLAGVSPLVALGAPTFTPSGISVGGDISGGGPGAVNPDTGFVSAMGNMGQDISRAITATKTPEEKALIAAQTTKLANDTRVSDAQVNMMNAQANYYNARAVGTPPFPTVYNDTGQIVSGQSSGHVASGEGPAGGYSNEPPKILTHSPAGAGVVSGRSAPSDQAYAVGNNMIEFQPSPGSPAAQGDIFNSAFNFVRNRLAGGNRELHPPEVVMRAVRSVYPDAVDYEHRGLGYYRAIFPEEQVRKDVLRSRN